MSGYLKVSRGAKGDESLYGQLYPRPGGPSTDYTHSTNPPVPPSPSALDSLSFLTWSLQQID